MTFYFVNQQFFGLGGGGLLLLSQAQDILTMLLANLILIKFKFNKLTLINVYLKVFNTIFEYTFL